MKRSSHNKMFIYIAAIILLWLAVAYISPFFAPYEFDYSENIINVETDEGTIVTFSPHPPSDRHLFGTDKFGYDLLTSMLYGAKYTIMTMMITSILRVMLGFVIGYFQALHGNGKRRSFSLIHGLPIFIIVYFIVFGFIINPTQPPIVITAIQIFLFSLFGLPSTIPVFREKIAFQLETSYIEAARSSGGSDWWILTHHILPHQIEDIGVLFMQEIVSVLTLIGQLGIFSLFIGGTRLSTDPVELISITREWGGLIGQNLGKLGTNKWWMITYPMAAYLLLFFSSYLFSYLIEKQSRVSYFKASNL